MIGDDTIFTQCQRKHLALTTKGTQWPPDTRIWVAGSPAALAQLTDMARVYLRDMRRPERDSQRIWDRDDAQALLIHLCETVLDCCLYPDTESWEAWLKEANP